MSDYIPTRYEEFQFLMKRILLDSLTLEEVGIFHFCLQSELQLPERLLCSPNVPMAILRHLKNNNTIKNWCKEPQSLKKVLIELHRKDLADRVDYFKENGKDMPKHLQVSLCSGQQEATSTTDGGETLAVPDALTRCPLQESDNELVCSGISARITKGRERANTNATVSTASSGYGSFSGQHQLVAMVTGAREGSFSGRADPNGDRRNSSLGALAEEQDTVDNPKLRSRPRSLPDKATLMANRDQALAKSRLTSTSSSTNSLESSNSSMGQNSSDDSCATDHGSQEHVSSSKRLPTFSSIRVSGEVQLSIKKVFSDICKGEQLPHKSQPFPKDLKGLQFELHFYSSKISTDSCALYIDISRGYLKKTYKHVRMVTLKIPAMEVTVEIYSVDTRGTKHPEHAGLGGCIEQAIENVPASSHEIQDLPGFMKSKQNFVTVTSFPHLLRHSKLEQFRECPQRSIVIQVVLKCFT